MCFQLNGCVFIDNVDHMNITSQILYSVHCRFFTAFANLTKICVQVLIRICLQYEVKPKQTKYLLAVFFLKVYTTRELATLTNL